MVAAAAPAAHARKKQKRVRNEAQKAARRVANGGPRRNPAQREAKNRRLREERHTANPDMRRYTPRRKFANKNGNWTLVDDVYRLRWAADEAAKNLKAEIEAREAAQARAEAEKEAREAAEARAAAAEARAQRAGEKISGRAPSRYAQFLEWKQSPQTKELGMRADAAEERAKAAEKALETYRQETAEWSEKVGLAELFAKTGALPSRSQLEEFFAPCGAASSTE